MATIDGKQIAYMLYHAGVETVLTVGYSQLGRKLLNPLGARNVGGKYSTNPLETQRCTWLQHKLEREIEVFPPPHLFLNLKP